jgi:hypothetical protein
MNWRHFSLRSLYLTSREYTKAYFQKDRFGLPGFDRLEKGKDFLE